MGDALKAIVEALGLAPVWGAILTLVVIAGVGSLRLAIERAFERQRRELELSLQDRAYLQRIFERVAEFSIEESQALRQAYRDLFEGGQNWDDGEVFAEAVARSDEKLMQPLRSYLGLLDDATEDRVTSIHNLLVQFRGARTPEERQALLARRNDFYRELKATQAFIRPRRILERLELLSTPNGKEKP